MPDNPVRILILGGTAEARVLAGCLEDDARFSPITSLAGVTGNPARIAGDIRTGGFGGAEGLAGFVRQENIALMVDAAHPFAAQISANAAQASAQTKVSCLRLERPAWEREAGDDWVHAADIDAAVKAIPDGARVLVTVGRQEAARFFTREDIHVFARMIEPLDMPVPAHAEICLARPPFAKDQECTLLKKKRITVLVTKNSGADATFAKIEAARELCLPVIMIARPVKAEAVTAASSVDEMMRLIESGLR